MTFYLFIIIYNHLFYYHTSMMSSRNFSPCFLLSNFLTAQESTPPRGQSTMDRLNTLVSSHESLVSEVRTLSSRVLELMERMAEAERVQVRSLC